MKRKPITLGKSLLIIAIAGIIFFAIIYLITSWYAMSFTVWGRQGRCFFAVAFLGFSLIAAYGYRIVTSNALSDEMNEMLDELEKDEDGE